MLTYRQRALGYPKEDAMGEIPWAGRDDYGGPLCMLGLPWH